MILHGYCSSSAAWRVRIALGLKRVVVEHRFHNLRTGEQKAEEYVALNPQGLVPALVLDDGTVLTQAMAIIEWLDETIPEPALLPGDALARARIRAFALAVVADTHPPQNSGVMQGLRRLGLAPDVVIAWSGGVNERGLRACEALLAEAPGPFCFGAAPTLADICVVPQLGNARRYGVDVSQFPRLLAREAACRAVPAFAAAVPEVQADFVG